MRVSCVCFAVLRCYRNFSMNKVDYMSGLAFVCRLPHCYCMHAVLLQWQTHEETTTWTMLPVSAEFRRPSVGRVNPYSSDHNPVAATEEYNTVYLIIRNGHRPLLTEARCGNSPIILHLIAALQRSVCSFQRCPESGRELSCFEPPNFRGNGSQIYDPISQITPIS